MGYRCLLSEVDGKIAGYTWAHTGRPAELLEGLSITVPSTLVYNFDGFTHPDFRGFGLQGVRHRAILDQPEWRAREGLIGYVAGTNYSSKKGQGKSGYVCVGAVRTACLGRRRYAYFTRSLRRAGVKRATGGAREGSARVGETDAIRPIRALLERLRRAVGVRARGLRRRLLHDTLMYPLAVRRHRVVCREATRSGSHTFTCFERLPLQLDALFGPALDFLGSGQVPGRLRLIVLAGSTGAEAYTLSSELLARYPDLDFEVVASDLHPELVDLARGGCYLKSDIFANGDISRDFLAQTFEPGEGDTLTVRPEVRARVSFEEADLLDEALARRFGPADLVFAQNVFFHLPPHLAERAFRNVVRILAPRACLLVDGMNLDMKMSLTRELDLAPLRHRYREIYASARRHIPHRWWEYYYGCEPFRWTARDRVRRYSTIFLRPTGDVRPLL